MRLRPETLVDPIKMARDNLGREGRAAPPEAMLAAVHPLMAGMGITRIADLTNLDVIGIPVAQVVRPNSRSNAVFQGKGLTQVQARVSALMEAVETWHAERILRPLLFASARELASLHRTLRADALPQDARGRYHKDFALLWIEGTNLLDGAPMWLPYECVHSRFDLPGSRGGGCFLSSTTGLASGGRREEAIRQALCEVVERDATTLFLEAETEPEHRRVDPDTVGSAVLGTLLARLREVGIGAALWDITSDLGVPAYRCLLVETEAGPGLLPAPAEGCGCDLDRDTALLRALLEAAQARLTAIAGTRDDIGPERYRADRDPGALRAWRQALFEAPTPLAHDAQPTLPSGDAGEDVDRLLEILMSAGFDQVVAVELAAPPGHPYAVVRVAVPGLEGLCGPGYRLGRRGMARQDARP